MDILFIFFKLFSMLILLFLAIIFLFIYPTNILYNNEKIESKGETNELLIGTFILMIVIDILLYLYYHTNSGYLCTISSYYECTNSSGFFAIYVLLFIQSISFILFNVAVINKIKEIIVTKKLDWYIFTFSSISILLTLLNYKIYANIYANAALIHIIPLLLVIIVTFAPTYLYLVINLVLKPKKVKKKKKKKKSIK